MHWRLLCWLYSIAESRLGTATHPHNRLVWQLRHDWLKERLYRLYYPALYA